MQNNKNWTFKIDWLKIVQMLSLNSIEQIPEYKKQKAFSKLEKEFGSENLAEMDPEYLEELIGVELRKLMQKELFDIKKKEKELRKKSRIIPLKHGGIIKIDASDFKDLKNMEGDIQDMLKGFLDKYFNQEDDESDPGEDSGEDSTGYYI
ncbi:MAG: hypothetical protein KAX10_07385 [Candidatus Lokiarchaeota archaeon]|nr:hypothetical protein [Candidatus Lokiarchaeota archaeon]